MIVEVVEQDLNLTFDPGSPGSPGRPDSPVAP